MGDSLPPYCIVLLYCEYPVSWGLGFHRESKHDSAMFLTNMLYYCQW